MSERINMNDWLEGIGETNCESNWSEVALMLTYTELPGIYIDLGQERVFSLDHITAKVVKNSKKTMVLELQNPTPYDAHVKVIAEKIQQTDSTAGGMTGKNERVLVKAGEHITYTINKPKN